MKGFAVPILVCMAQAFAALCAAAAREAPAELLERLNAKAEAVRTVNTAFVQEKHLEMLQHKLTIHGKVYMEKPDRLAWHVEEPIRYIMVMDDRAIRQWDAESGQKSGMALDKNPALRMAVDQMRKWFSGDYRQLRYDYRITLDEEDPVSLTFVPLAENPASGHIGRVTVRFTDDERYLSSIIIEERGGDLTELRFYATELNGEIPFSAWDIDSAADE